LFLIDINFASVSRTNFSIVTYIFVICRQAKHYSNLIYRGADKSIARPERKQARKHVRDARDFNDIETRAVTKFVFLQGKAPKEIHYILTETLACFLPGRAKDLSAAPVGLIINFQGGYESIIVWMSDSLRVLKETPLDWVVLLPRHDILQAYFKTAVLTEP